MKSENILVFIAALAAFSAIFSAGFSYYSLSSFRDTWVTGYAFSTANATINLTVGTLLSLNFTNRSILWGTGYVNDGQSQANLTTRANVASVSSVGGSWAITAANGANGFVLENIGNVNATIHLRTTKNSTQLLGGTSPVYQFNVSVVESGSCLNTTHGTTAGGIGGLTTLAVFQDVNTSSPGTPICGVFRYTDSADTLRVDVHLQVPYDSLQGNLSDTFVMAYCEAPGPCA